MDSILVKEFTEESTGILCPNMPEVMNKNEVRFLIKNMISEMMELAQTVSDTPHLFVEECLYLADLPKEKKLESEDKIIAEQADALVDMWYYGLNAFCKKGVNVSSMFKVVHQANMNKRFPDGKFHKREDGKIEKPLGFQDPDIVGCIVQQKTNGSWCE
jgi:predicted HAD superfamily Cof-like phosphohydrolase